MHDNILKAHPEADLAVFVVWSPIRPGDEIRVAERRGTEFSDPRLTVLWDEDKAIGTALSSVLNVGDAPFAWDVYCVFDSRAEWGDSVPTPWNWAHQLGGADPARFYGDRLAQVLSAWTGELLGGAPSRAQPAQPSSRTFTVGPEDIHPVSVLLLDQVLDDMADDPRTELDVGTLSTIRTELRKRMVEATQPLLDAMPKAIRLDGKVHILPDSECLEQMEARSEPRRTGRSTAK